VKLQHGQINGACDLPNLIFRCVHKQANAFYSGGSVFHLSTQLSGPFSRQITRAVWVKIEAERVAPRRYHGADIFGVRNTANFTPRLL